MDENYRPDIAASLRAIHGVISHGLEVIRESAAERPATVLDESSRIGFRDYVLTFAQVLNAHHLTEDEVAFPYFRSHELELPYETLMADHQVMARLAERVEQHAYSLAPGVDGMPVLGAMEEVAAQLAGIWHPHIGVEETHITAEGLRKLLAPDENLWLTREFAEHSRKYAQPDALVIPFMLFNLLPDQRGALTSEMPEVVTKELIPHVWREEWRPMERFLLTP